MEGLLSLATILGASGTILWMKSKQKHYKMKDGFQANEFVQPSVQKAVGPVQTEFIEASAQKFNPVMNLLDPVDNPVLKRTFATPTAQSDIQDTLRIAMKEGQSFDASLLNSIQIPPEGSRPVVEAVQTCEAVQTINCDAFDDPNFSASCGVCHEGGQTSASQPTTGGLYVTEDSKRFAKRVAKQLGSRRINYAPTVGKCNPLRFSTTKEQCVRIKRQMECEAKQGFSVEGCAQCLQDGRFMSLDESNQLESPSIDVVGSGTLTINRVGKPASVHQLSNTVTTIELLGCLEGESMTLEVKPETASLAGMFYGTTPSGTFSLDLVSLIQSDAETGAKPRLTGMLPVGKDSYTVMRPGRGKSGMKLVLVNPFTFVSPYEYDAIQCPSTPFVTKESSATLLESNPCFKRGQGPGRYSLECLQQTFIQAGCTVRGDGYPSNDAKAVALAGNLRIGSIGETVYQRSLTAYNGRNQAGEKLPILEWDKTSRFCTGRSITSACDFDDQTNGPLSQECLLELWTNQGAGGRLGPSYTNVPSTSSLQATAKNTAQYCTLQGNMAPIPQQAEAIRIAQGAGGVESVKSFYNKIHRLANDNSLPDAQRAEAIQQCYGVELRPPANTQPLANQPSNLVSVLDDRAGRTQSAFQRKNFQWSSVPTQPAVELGPFGMKPWERTWNGAGKFPTGTAAKWIWNRPGAERDAPTGVPITFTYFYTNSTNAPIEGVFHVVIDNVGQIRFNNQSIASNVTGYGSVKLVLQPGANLIQVLASNQGGPAGWVGACQTAKQQTLFVTNSSWMVEQSR